MIKCQKCGDSIPDNSKFCLNCGEKVEPVQNASEPAPEAEKPQEQTPTEPQCEPENSSQPRAYVQPPQSGNQYQGQDGQNKAPFAPGYAPNRPPMQNPPRKRQMRYGMLAWSIVNTVLGVCSCCTSLPTLILGIIAIVMTASARDCRTASEEAQKIKTAKILNIVASAWLGLMILITLITAIRIPGIIRIQAPGTNNLMPYGNTFPW